MSTLLLRLAAPMQAWGSDSRFDVRRTCREPTKSGVIGLLAAALGRGRDESVEDLCHIRFGVRVDQEGKLLHDFHTAHSIKQTYVSHRYYLSDAAFLVGLESDNTELLQKLERALQEPIFSLFLGRRSCPPTQPITLGIREKTLLEALRQEPWIASEWTQSKYGNQIPALRLVVDAQTEETKKIALQRDLPISFHVQSRQYTYRAYTEYPPILLGGGLETEHDPMSEL